MFQRSNPHLKYFGFLATAFLMTICVTVGPKVMLDLFPWILIGTLLVSSLFYVFTRSVRHWSGHNRSMENVGASTRTGGDTHPIRGLKALEQRLEDKV